MEFFSNKIILILLSLALIFTSGVVLLTNVFDTPLLSPEKGAAWIYIDRPFIMEAQREGERITYRKRFSVEAAPLPATLAIRTLGTSQVFIDGKRIQPVKSAAARWKESVAVDLTGVLVPGIH